LENLSAQPSRGFQWLEEGESFNQSFFQGLEKVENVACTKKPHP
jgi:hypothetical protein